jgi:nucleoside 2-deoxyribosyltransferase
MVDGKGGNLKTIHHYKTERVYLATPPFRLSFVSLISNSDANQSISSANTVIGEIPQQECHDIILLINRGL